MAILFFLAFALCPGFFLNSFFKCMEKIHRQEEYADDRFWAIFNLCLFSVALFLLLLALE